jgi:hypothetical protein
MSKKNKENCCAVATIRKAAKMTPEGRHAIALWLRRAGEALEREGKYYSDKFTARYLYLTK